NAVLAGSERSEDRRQARERLTRAADHQTVTAFGAPDAAARAGVHVVETTGSELSRAPNIVLVVAVAAVDDRVARIEGRSDCLARFFSRGTRGHHNPPRARPVESTHEIVDR